MELRLLKPAPRTADDRAGATLEQLVEQAATGDIAAWAQVYRACFDPVFRYVRLLTGDTDVAEDLTQDTFATALTCVHNFAGRSSLTTWLRGVALNVVRRHWRARRGSPTPAPMPIDIPAGHRMDDEAIRRARIEALYAVLESMPLPLREAFLLRDILGHTQRGAAALLEINENTLAIRATRARRHLREALARLGWIEGEAP